MDEAYLLAALLASREAFDSLQGRLDPADFSETGRLVVRSLSQFYKRDPQAASVDRAVVESEIRRAIPNPKHADSACGFLARLPDTVSATNVSAEYRALRRHNVGLELADALVRGDHGNAKTERLVEKYRALGVEQSGERAKLSVEDLIDSTRREGIIRLVPSRLDEIVGGVMRGHNITICGRPESGKTMFAIHLSAGFLAQGLRVLYTGNEEPIRDLQLRFLSRLAGISIDDIKQYPKALRAAVRRSGEAYERLIAQELKSGTTAELEALVRRYTPDVLVIDQMRNLKFPGEGNRTNELDGIAREIRRLGIAYNMLTLGVTQAGDSAEGRLKLSMHDIDSSKTGIPGAADLLIGIGVNNAYERTHRRMLTLCKNKVSGVHESFPLVILPKTNRYTTRRGH